MNRNLARKWSSVALMVGGILLATSIDARAGLQVTLTQGATTSTFIVATPPGFLTSSLPFTFGDYSIIAALSSSNSPGSATGTLSITTLNITRLTGTLGDPLYLSASATGYTSPAGSASFSSSYTSNFLTSIAGDHVVFDSSFDPGNNNMAQTPAIVFGAGMSTTEQDNIGTAAGVTNLATETNTSTGGSTIPLSIPAPALSAFDPGAYSITTRIKLTEAIGSTVSISTQAVVTSVPEPGSLALVGIALPMLGLGAWRRRRNATKA